MYFAWSYLPPQKIGKLCYCGRNIALMTTLTLIPFVIYSVPISPVACRGSWMPGANKVLGCPQIQVFNISLSSKKIFFSFFLVIYPFFPKFSHCFSKNSYDLLGSPLILDTWAVTFFLLFLSIYLHFS